MKKIDEEIDTLQTECCDHCLIGSYDIMNRRLKTYEQKVFCYFSANFKAKKRKRT